MMKKGSFPQFMAHRRLTLEFHGRRLEIIGMAVLVVFMSATMR
jgi:hypothetical protein